MDWLYHVSASIAASVVFKFVVLPLLMTTAVGGVVRFAFDKLKKSSQIIAFGVGSFLLFLALIALVFRPQQPELNGGIQGVIAGKTGERDMTAVFTVNITNTGSMQTIIKNWKVAVSANGRNMMPFFRRCPTILHSTIFRIRLQTNLRA